MKKIESLTPEQLQIMQSVKQEWLDRFFSCKTQLNKEAITKGVEWMYLLTGRKKPIMIFVDSPMACQWAVYYLKNVFNDGTLAQVRAQVGDQKITFESFCSYGSVWDYGWSAFYDFFTRIGIINLPF